jgi:trigger factor
MQVSVEDVSSLTKKLIVVIDEKKMKKAFSAAYRKVKSEVSLKGFRKGKIPQKILEKNFGEQVKNDVAEKMVQETYFDALGETKIDAVTHPEVKKFDYADDGSFTYEAEVDIRPQFDLGQYKELEIEQLKMSVTDDEVNSELEEMRKQMAPLRGVDDRGIQKDDLAIVDFQGFNEGEIVKEIAGTNYSVDVGSGKNGKEFEDSLIGLKKGAKTSEEVEFPGDFQNPVMAGKKIEFKIDIKDVKERILAELDDEFAKDSGEEFNTLEDLKTFIHDKKLKEKQDSQAGDLNDKLMDKLISGHDFEVPARLVGYEVSEQIKELENKLEQQGLSLESTGMNREKLIEHYTEGASKRVQGDFILKKIAEVEEIKISDEDLKNGFERISQQYSMPVDEVKKFFQNRDDLLPFMNELLSEKVIGFLRDSAVVNTITAEEEAKEGEEAAQPAGGK